MRLQLALLAAALTIGAAATAAADGRAGSWLAVYGDDDRVTVISPRVAATEEVADELSIEVGYDADVISAASADVVSAASRRGFEEVRHGLRLGAVWSPEPGAALSLALVGSTENDYRSAGLVLAAVREWRDRRLSTGLELRLTSDQVGRAGEARAHWRSLEAAAASLAVAWIVDARTVADLTYELGLARGFLGSPYRYVPVVWESGVRMQVPEAVPERRQRHAAALGLRRALPRALFARAGYRLYRDSWGIWSHTGELEVQRAFRHDTVFLGTELRGYHQSAADFHRAAYRIETGMLPAHRDADKLLARSVSLLGALRLEVSLGRPGPLETLRVTAKLEHYRQRFSDFAALPRRSAWVGALGLQAEY